MNTRMMTWLPSFSYNMLGMNVVFIYVIIYPFLCLNEIVVISLSKKENNFKLCINIERNDSSYISIYFLYQFLTEILVFRETFIGIRKKISN